MKKLPIYDCVIDTKDDTGIFAMSFVDMPAIESAFVALQANKANQNRVTVALNKQKHLLTGAVLIPEQLIYRNDNQQGEHYIKFSADTIEKISHKLMQDATALSSTTHNHKKQLQGNYLVEMWIVENSKLDKSAALGIGNFPKGTLMASYKINDINYWQNEIQTGRVTGFSLEGLFNFKPIQMTTQMTTQKKDDKQKPKLSLFGKALQSIGVLLEGETADEAKDLVDEAKKDETDSGVPFLIFELSEGGEIWVDADGNATLNGTEKAPAGEHLLTDGNIIVIDDNSMLVVTQDENDGASPEVPETELKKAKLRGQAFLKKQKSSTQAQIAELKRKIAELEKQPSAGQSKPTVSSPANFKDLTPTQRMAVVIKNRLENK